MAQFRKVQGEKFNGMPERVHFPSIHLNQKQLPEIKDWEVGKNYEIALKVRQTSKREDDDKKISGSFDIVGIKVFMSEEESKKQLRKASNQEIDNKMKESGM